MLLAVFLSCDPEGSEKAATPKAWHVSTFAGGNELAGHDGTGTGANFLSPFSIAQIGDTLYVTDGKLHSLRVINTNTAQVVTVVNPGSSDLIGSYRDGDGTLAKFNGPRGLVAVGGSTLYVADLANNRIRKVTIGATAVATDVDTFAGNGTEGHKDDTGTAAQFNQPISLAVNGNTLYVADYSGHRIRAIDLASRAVTTIAGNGTAGYKDGMGIAAQFNKPAGLAVNGNTLYVADYIGHRIRAIDLASRAVTTIAGSGTIGHKDGTGTAAQFNKPVGLAVNGNTLYVASFGNRVIRKLEYK